MGKLCDHQGHLTLRRHARLGLDDEMVPTALYTVEIPNWTGSGLKGEMILVPFDMGEFGNDEPEEVLARIFGLRCPDAL